MKVNKGSIKVENGAVLLEWGGSFKVLSDSILDFSCLRTNFNTQSWYSHNELKDALCEISEDVCAEVNRLFDAVKAFWFADECSTSNELSDLLWEETQAGKIVAHKSSFVNKKIAKRFIDEEVGGFVKYFIVSYNEVEFTVNGETVFLYQGGAIPRAKQSTMQDTVQVEMKPYTTISLQKSYHEVSSSEDTSDFVFED